MARNKSWNIQCHVCDKHNKYSCVDDYIYTIDICIITSILLCV
jgi:hypothetical protein